MGKKGYVSAAVLVLAAVIVGLQLQRAGVEPAAAVLRPADADCDSARRPCVASGDGLEVEWQLGPSLRPMQAFAMQLRRLRGELGQSAQVMVDFQMRDMDMGLNRYRLEAADAGVWQGRATLPVCVSGRSDWIARLTIHDGARTWTAELPFTVEAD